MIIILFVGHNANQLSATTEYTSKTIEVEEDIHLPYIASNQNKHD